ncbi:RNA polymerase sigma factor [Clostridium sp. CF012]|uniref:RNA polymerase sigma factor n=1 Tax=Clostridium sp. CF012 TaxID=2843319 RepID=UPI001C0BF779|nr:RNA polymerase sigma factor [Clostridium sp. CF012]MBU3146196.1 RNA polymerase sigma factor [Clostridium sp. CF012]
MANFENIYNQYFQDVYSFVLSLSRNETVAEEITQETFFKALKNIDNFKGNCKVSVWLCQIAKNTYFSYIDKQKSFEPSNIYEKVINNGIDEVILNKEDAFYIHTALHYLGEPYKEVFTLRVFGELSFANISLIFGKTESWARVTFHRAKLKIQNYLKEVQK